MGKHTNRRFCLGSWGALPIPLRVLSGFAGVVMASAAVFRGFRATVFCTPALVACPVPYLLALFLCKLLAKKTLLHFQGLGCSMYCCGAQSLFDFVLCSYMEPKSRQFLVGIIWGLWIAGFANYSPDLWGQPCRVSAISVSRRGFSPPEGCM